MEITSNSYLFLFIASGALNKLFILFDGNRVIFKGTSTKEQKQVDKMDEETGVVSSAKLIDHYKTVVYGLSLTHGQFVKYE